MKFEHLFKMNFVILFAWIFIVSSLFFTTIILFEDSFNVYWIAYGISIAFLVLFSLIVSFIMVLYFKTTLSNKGIRGFNIFGAGLFIEWVNISNVKPINIFGLKFLRVFPNNSYLALWLPLFVNNPDDFSKKSTIIPPDGNPFREFFAKQYG